jgi:hypothetical protein
MTKTSIKTENVLETTKYTKRIGSTNYIVTVHFNDTATETMEDKLLRLIKNEVRNSA